MAARRPYKNLLQISAPGGAPPGAEIQIFEISKILKKLKNCFNKYIRWKSDQEEFQIMMFCISEWTHIIHNIISEFKISSLVGRFRAAWRADGAPGGADSEADPESKL